MVNQITLNELEELIANDEIPEEAALQYIEPDLDSSKAFQPAFRAKPGMIVEEDIAAEGEIFMRIFNRASRKRRERLYRKKIDRGWDGLKIVSEGDSWFQYPIMLNDVIDQLFDRYAILSLGAAGDWITNIVLEHEYLRVLESEKPDVFLISGGGNDLVGGGRLAEMLHPFEPGRLPEGYPNQSFIELIDEIRGIYMSMFSNVTSRYPDMKVVCHGYDHAIPNNGKWLGKPMRHIGINDAPLQKDIMKVVMNRFNVMLEDVASHFPQVYYVNARGAVGDGGWHDELHPENGGFEAVAERFVEVIEIQSGT